MFELEHCYAGFACSHVWFGSQSTPKSRLKKELKGKGIYEQKQKKIMTRGRLELPTLSDMVVKDT